MDNRENDLIIGYIDISKDDSKYPLSVFMEAQNGAGPIQSILCC